MNGTPDAGGKVSTDRVVEGAITCLRIAGVIDESFEGKSVGASIQAQTLIVDLAQVKRISSFGVREWSEFIRRAERDVDEILLVQCPPKVVDQVNMVSGFLGSKGRVVSFYAPYHCDYCDSDSRLLLRTDRDADVIRRAEPPDRICQVCTRDEYFDEDAITYFAFCASQPPVEVSAQVADFLEGYFGEFGPVTSRPVQVEKHVNGRNTYLRLVGNLDGSFSASKIAEGLEGEVVVDLSGVAGIDGAGANEWRNFVTLTRAASDRMSLVDCPASMLETLPEMADLGDQIVSLTMPFSCSKCRTTSAQVVDVASNHEVLRLATPPEVKCTRCKTPMVCIAPEPLLGRLRELPRPDVSGGLARFIKEARAKSVDKPRAAKARAKRKSSTGARIWAAVAVVAVLVAGGLVGLNYMNQQKAEKVAEEGQQAEVERRMKNLKAARPEWITFDQPGQAGCFDTAEKIFCVGVSTYRTDREKSLQEAWEVAQDEFVNLMALRSESDVVRQQRAMYSQEREAALGALKNLRFADDREQLYEKLEELRPHWTRVAESLRRTGGAGIAQQAGSYWEEYERRDNQGETEFLGFVQVQLSNASLDDILRRYSTPRDLGGGKVVPVFPGLAWSADEPVEGLYVLEAGDGALAEAGVAKGDVVTGVGEVTLDYDSLESVDSELAAGGSIRKLERDP